MQDALSARISAPGSTVRRESRWAWLLRIARNLALMRLRNAKRSVTMSPEDWMEAFAAQPEFTRRTRRALSALMDAPEGRRAREIVTLHALAGFKHREIAAMLDLALPTVLSKYNRSLKKLRNLLQGG